MTDSRPAILAISSTVTVGHVGLSAILPTLNLIGHTAAALPTITLSNHPRFPHASGIQTGPETLTAMLDAIEKNGWLNHFDTILTGYLPSAAHVEFARSAIHRVRALNPDAHYICDPVLGDDPHGLYIDECAARAIRDTLLPLADVALPNRFELSWLTGLPVTSPDDAIAAARTLPCSRVIAKSVPADTGYIRNIDISPDAATSVAILESSGVPNGTGDTLSSMIAAGWSVPRATAALKSIIGASLGREHLAIVETADQWRTSRPLPTVPLTAVTGTPFVAGVDGCPAGWIAVMHPLDQPALATWHIFETFEQLIRHTENFAAVAVDMPIGLPDTASLGGRDADRQARAVLGARQSSVFSVPARATIACTDYRAACNTNLRHSEPPRKVAKQTFNLFPKIREVDQLMTPALQDRIVECHPEVVFWSMNGNTPLSEPKKSKSAAYTPGLDLRRHLLAKQGYDEHFLTSTECPRKLAATDDFLDACAAAWTANRLANGLADRLPPEPPLDSRLLRMEIVY